MTEPQRNKQEPSWKWPEAKVFEAVNRVRAGRDLTPRRWPRGARVAAGLSFDVDNETPSLRDGQTSPALMAQGEYGARAGLPRILALLDRYRLPATFFVPAISAKLHPQSMKDIVEKGRHEVGIHGWIHERNSLLEEADERDLMQRSVEALTEITGKKPVGMRTPSWDFSPATMKLVRESWKRDIRPFFAVPNAVPYATMTIEEVIRELERSESHVRFSKLLAICKHFFGRPRIVGSHHIFKTPWIGDPRINLQKDKGDAKPYQVRQVLRCLRRLKDRSVN